jgi:choline-sulfatase
MRAKALGTALAVAFLALSCRNAETPAAPAGPRGAVRDVVLVTIDTLRADAVGFGGNARGTTPNLDRFAAEGRVFPYAHAHNVLTLPSHTNILTGLYPYQHGVRDNSGFRLDKRFETAATRLSSRGFAAAAFVAAFPLDGRYGLTRGFDPYDELYHHVDEPREFEIPQSRADEVVTSALAWYRSKEGTPRFLWVHLYDPHAPYDPPEDFRKRFPDDPYLGEVAYTDSALVPLLEALRATSPPPLLIVTGDHGEARGDHKELTHGLFAYEATLHIPLFLWCPGLVLPGRDERSARHVDILPTVLWAVGAPDDAGLPGRPLLVPATEPQESYFESLGPTFNRGWAPLRGVLRDRNKYIDLPIQELYDLRIDPGEQNNLAASDSATFRKLRKDLLETPAGPTERGSVGSEEAAQLRSLGYLSGSTAPKARYGVQDDPKNLIAVDAQLHQTVALYETGHPDEAIAVARQIVAANPRMKAGYEHLGFLLQEKGDLVGAIGVFERASASGAAGENMDRRRALLLCESGRPKEAITLLWPYRDGSDTETLNALGIALADSGRGDEGLATFHRVLDISARDTLAYQNTGIALLKMDRAAEARENLEKALAIHERNPRAWNALGVAWMRLGDPGKALEAWGKCLSYNPKQYDALYNTARVAAGLGDRSRAREAMERFIETAPPAQYGKDIAQVRAALAALDGKVVR